MNKNIVVIGFKSSGKTFYGKFIAEYMGFDFIDIDENIKMAYSNVQKRISIREIYKKIGKKRFRLLEKKELEKIKDLSGIVISTGGGIIEIPENREILKKIGQILYLDVAPEIIKKRIFEKKELPAFIDKVSFENLFSFRKKIYESIADKTVKILSDDIIKNIIILKNALAIKNLSEICISPGYNTVKKYKERILDIVYKCDIIEIRADMIVNLDIKELISLVDILREYNIKVIIKADKRLLQYIDIFSLRNELIDIDYSYVKNIHLSPENLILSYHDYKKTPDLKEMENLYKRLNEIECTYKKMIFNACSINDVFKVFQFLSGKKDLISFCMGEKGFISRILCKKFGSTYTYSGFDNKITAEGQADISVMKNVYSVWSIDKKTKIFGIIGKNASKTLSVRMHNLLYRKKGINAVFLPFEIEDNEIEEFLLNFRKYDFKGASITMPFKIKILPFLDSIDDESRNCGAVNTIINNNGFLFGYNTDVYAIKKLFKNIFIKDKKIFVFGAGGIARAIISGLIDCDEIFINNRTIEHAEIIAKEFGAKVVLSNSIIETLNQCDIIINATSLGGLFNEKKCVLSKKNFKLINGRKIFFDVVYSKTKTPFLKYAEEFGHEIITGIEMFIFQGIRQFEIMTGKKINYKIFRNNTMKIIKEKWKVYE